MLTDTAFREHVLAYKHPEDVQNFREMEFNQYSSRQRSEYTASILNKVGLFTACNPLKNTFQARTNTLKMETVMDEKKILICNLSKGILGEEASTILGSILVTAIQSSALYRVTIPESERIPFHLYIDECHIFTSNSIANILAESRKYRLSLFLAHQYIGQLSEPIKDAIFGNAGTLISFRVGVDDAIHLAKEFHPIFNESDLINLPKYHMYIKLIIDGETSQGFSCMSIVTTL